MEALTFDLEVLDIHWIKDVDDGHDLCAHGKVYVNIGGEVVSNDKHDWTLSAAGLFLLRTLFTNYTEKMYGNFLLPHCGFSFWPEKDYSRVMFPGCGTGVDWTIEHLPGKVVRHTSDMGTQAVHSLSDFRLQVLKFVERVEQFYHISKPRILPKDQFEQDGYLLFWKEWYELKNKLLL